jgi:XTP/dITP diphosphohydrolase
MVIAFASGNVHKKEELSLILSGHTILTPKDLGISVFDPPETGSTFAENALLKANALYRLPKTTGADTVILADDSGLCVDALGGRPGIFSARYPNGKKLPDRERNALLLDELNELNELNEKLKGKPQNRKACFVCAMVLLFSPERFYLVQETMEGEIVPTIEAARGLGGFGYDPILYLSESGCTVAELSEAEKNRISHRAKAARAVAKLLA